MRVDRALALSDQLDGLSETPKLDCELLLCHLLNKPRSYLYAWPDIELSQSQQQNYTQLLERRVAGEPVAHLIGRQGFWTLELEVSPDTLIPRPETELLVEWALQQFSDQPVRVADLGTGTGAIALALASERPGWQITATELHPGAVLLAQRNAERLGIHNVQILAGSWCAPLSGRYELILSNPPYIDSEHICLTQGDVRYEPRSALVAEQQGMADIIDIIHQAPNYLVKGGWLVFEHGYDQGGAVRAQLDTAGFQQCFTQLDLNGHERITGGCYASER
ncbi:peptide chain release factor N(5)-glutamine methyltransferase [Nitrincola sp.]|uniref:peptide chain release factor N(5)-glutamine methyltransferase n=1 Tax=Nitrincola sp. TaxID=1926584 RepID=UPI003A95435A